jgi:cytochrome c553
VITPALLLPYLWIAFATIPTATAIAGDNELQFNRDIRPILAANCFACHGPDASERQAELRLDDRDVAIASGAIVPGDADASELWRRITSTDPDLVMPPRSAHRQLTNADHKLLARWINEGAVYQRHWSFEPPARPVVQAGVHPVDALIAAVAQDHAQAPAAEADRRTLIRRLTFDLTGLPPTLEEVQAFQADDSPEAWNRLIDRLLASPHYGERMAVPWLDVVRFADTIGYHSDNPRNVWPYRDWVIRSFQQNKPFDQFTIEQLAGDMLPDRGDDALLGSAFNRLLLTTEEGGAQPADYAQRMLADRVRAVGTVWLGLTTGCAQCHDHKFDPFTTRDFYSLASYFADVEEPDVGRREDGARVTLTAAQRERRQALEEAIVAARKGGHADELARAESRLAAFTGTLPQCLVTRRRTTPQTVRILPRGNWMDDSGEVVPAAVPQFLNEIMTTGTAGSPGSSRLDLARWLVRRDHPLTARVQMNRLWKQFFGTPLSRFADDLGTQGDLPVQQPLLDWLACEFMDSGWNTQHMIRWIVTSEAYRRSTAADPRLIAADPDNRLLLRQSSFRLDAEFLRDSALTVSGLLNSEVGGPSVFPLQPDGYWDNLNFPPRKYQPSNAPASHRRGLYVWWQRTFLHPSLLAFDAPSREECTADRPRSNIPQQALVLLNDPIFQEAHAALANLVLQQAVDDDSRIQRMWQLALQRPVAGDELAIVQGLLQQHRQQESGISDEQLWIHAARVVMNLHEFVVRP